MRFVLFYHSLISDWNHGNAHFLRGMMRALRARGHAVTLYEPCDGWSRRQLVRYHGSRGVRAFRDAFPDLSSCFYDEPRPDLRSMLRDADAVLVHEWNTPALVAALGAYRRRHPDFALLFHDTHHRCISRPEDMARYDLRYYDGVLAFGEAIRRVYLSRGWARRAWTWHEAADVTHYHARSAEMRGDLVWIGNWGDDERADELEEFLLGPVERLGLSGTVRGVRYPPRALERIARAGLEYRGWASARDAVGEYAAHRVTVHVPRRQYATQLPGIPTIRVFEALACGMPLVCAPWDDAEGLFSPGEDYLVAPDGEAMEAHLRALCADSAMREGLARRGLETVRVRHTCGHRADELLDILGTLGVADPAHAAHGGTP